MSEKSPVDLDAKEALLVDAETGEEYHRYPATESQLKSAAQPDLFEDGGDDEEN